MDNIISNVNSIYTNGTYASGTGNSLEDKINNKDLSKATDDELMEVCKDFESYFLEQMLKSMVKMTKVDGDTDDSNLKMYLEENYELTSERVIKAGIDIVSNENKYHPIRDYLESLVWDGVPRIENILPLRKK